jgi:hypothetical protein
MTVGSVLVSVFGSDGRYFTSPIGFQLDVSKELSKNPVQKSEGSLADAESLWIRLA